MPLVISSTGNRLLNVVRKIHNKCRSIRGYGKINQLFFCLNRIGMKLINNFYELDQKLNLKLNKRWFNY